MCVLITFIQVKEQERAGPHFYRKANGPCPEQALRCSLLRCQLQGCVSPINDVLQQCAGFHYLLAISFTRPDPML